MGQEDELSIAIKLNEKGWLPGTGECTCNWKIFTIQKDSYNATLGSFSMY